MRKIFLMALALCFMLSSVAFAQTSIGIVDMQVLATQSEPAKDAKKHMEKKFGAEKKQLEKQTKSLQALAESLKKSNATEEKKVEFIRKKRELDEKARTFARKVEQDSAKSGSDLLEMIFFSTAKVAKAKNIDMVVEVRNGGVMYAQPSMDLTSSVMTEVNKQWKSGEWKKAK